MSSTHIRSIAIAAESTLGSISASTGLPDVSGLTFYQLEADRASIEPAGDVTLLERAEARSGPYGLPGHVETMHDSGGTPQVRRTGTLSITAPFRGSGGDSRATSAFDLLLASAMRATAYPTDASDTAGTVNGANNFDPGDSVDNFQIGLLMQHRGNGRAQYSAVTNIAGATVHHSPAFPVTMTDADAVYPLRTYSAGLGSATGGSVAVRLDGDGWRTYLTGCRWSSLAGALEERVLKGTFNVEFLHAYDDHGNASVGDPTRLSGDVLQLLGSYVSLSSTASTGISAPAALDTVEVDVDELSFTLTSTLGRGRSSSSILGYDVLEVVDFAAEVSMVLSSPSSTVASDLLNQTHRSLMIGFGPHGSGEGGCLYLPAAYLVTDPSKRDLGGDIVRQALTYRQGRFSADSNDTAPGNTHVRLGLA